MTKFPKFTASPNGAIFSEDRAYRYLLWRTFDEGDGVVAIVGLNPSTADETANDPTIRRCIGFARDWGFRSLLVANLFAYRATRPEDLRKAPAPTGPGNDTWLARSTKKADLTVAAWGNAGCWQDRDIAVYKRLRAPHCLGVTRAGAPRHPLYTAAAVKPVAYFCRPYKCKP